MYKVVSAAEAVKVIKSNNRVYVQAAAAAPQVLMKAMTERHEELRNVEVCHLHVEGETPYANPELKDSLNGDDYDASKEAFILSIMALENDLEFLSDKYFDDGAERIAARLK